MVMEHGYGHCVETGLVYETIPWCVRSLLSALGPRGNYNLSTLILRGGLCLAVSNAHTHKRTHARSQTQRAHFVFTANVNKRRIPVVQINFELKLLRSSIVDEIKQ